MEGAKGKERLHSERQGPGSPRSRPTWGKTSTLLASEAAQAPGLGPASARRAAARPTAPQPARLSLGGGWGRNTHACPPPGQQRGVPPLAPRAPPRRRAPRCDSRLSPRPNPGSPRRELPRGAAAAPHRSGRAGHRRNPRRRLAAAAARRSAGPPPGHRTATAALPETAAVASRLGPFRRHAPGGRRTPLSRGRRPLSPLPRGERDGERPSAAHPPHLTDTGKGDCEATGTARDRDGRAAPAPGSLRPTRRAAAAPPPFGPGAAPPLSPAASGWTPAEPPLAGAWGGGARAGKARSRSAPLRAAGDAAAQRGRPARRDPTAGNRHRPGKRAHAPLAGVPPFRGKTGPAAAGPARRPLRRDRTAEKGGQGGHPSPARLPEGQPPARAAAAVARACAGATPAPGGSTAARPGARPRGCRNRAARVFKPPPGSAAFDPRAQPREGRGGADARYLALG